MELFELLNIIFTNSKAYKYVSNNDKKKHFFMLNRRMAIYYPLQSQLLQHIKINDVQTVDFWQNFISKQYNRTPYWMFTKGVKKTKEEKEKKLNIKESSIQQFAIYNNYDIKHVKDAIMFFPDEMKKEINNFEKLIS